MAQYTNGNIPKSVMKTFAGKYGHPQFIDQLNGFVNECRQNGINITVASGQDIFRDYAGQVYWRNYWTRQGRPGNAAVPGTSNHGFGIAADITGCGNRGSAVHNKCVATARKWNLSFSVPSESWHLQATNISTAGGKVTINASSSTGGGNRYFNREQYKAVQGGYRAIGYDLGASGQDGIEGPRMKQIVRDFQSKHNLPADGIHGPMTEKALVAAQPKAPTAPSKAGRPVVKLGSKNSAVGDLQRKLKASYPAYAGKLTVDNDFGKGTDAAVREFQRRSGLKVDGIVGASTWAKLGL